MESFVLLLTLPLQWFSTIFAHAEVLSFSKITSVETLPVTAAAAAAAAAAASMELSLLSS
jgi:hypothetical protein